MFDTGAWGITGDVKAIEASRGTVEGWTLDLHSNIKTLKLGLVEQAEVTIGDLDSGRRGDAGTISAAQWNEGTIFAGSIKNFVAKASSQVVGADGDMKADVQLTGSANAKITQTMGKATIAGQILDCFWDILVGDIGSITDK